MRKTFCDTCKKEIDRGHEAFQYDDLVVDVFRTNGVSKGHIGELCKKCLLKEILYIAKMDMAKDKEG